MAVAVKTTASKARAIGRSGAPFRNGIGAIPVGVSKNTVPADWAEVTRNEPNEATACQREGTLRKRLIVGVTPVELHQMGPRLSHEDRQRQRSTDGKPDL